MDSISHMPSPKSLSNSFHCWLNLFAFHSPRVSQQFWCYFSPSFSTFEDRSRVFPKSCPLSRKFAVLARWLSYQIVTSRAMNFTHPEYFRSCFPSQLSGGLHFRIFLHSRFSNPFSDYSIFMPFSFISIFFRCFAL